MRIIEDSYYQHDQHGLVRVVSVNNGVVSMELQDDDKVIGTATVPRGAQQAAAGFQDDAEPADVTVEADLAVLNVENLDPESYK